jgi:hypothetical protein
MNFNEDFAIVVNFFKNIYFCSASEIVFLGGYDFVTETHFDLVEKLNIETGKMILGNL